MVRVLNVEYNVALNKRNMVRGDCEHCGRVVCSFCKKPTDEQRARVQKEKELRETTVAL